MALETGLEKFLPPTPRHMRKLTVTRLTVKTLFVTKLKNVPAPLPMQGLDGDPPMRIRPWALPMQGYPLPMQGSPWVPPMQARLQAPPMQGLAGGLNS